MKSLSSGSPGAEHMNYLPKLLLRRTRTCSSDSGCDVLCDSPDLSSTIMEDAIHTWEIRLDGVVKQEVERAREVTSWAKEALRYAAEDEERRQEVLESWRSQLEGIMEFTKDLVDCVNNDTKEVMYDTMGLSSGHESSSIIDEEEEDNEEKEEVVRVDLKVKYYDDPEIKTEWNEFNFWKIIDLSDNLRIDLDSRFLGDSEEDKVWTNCKFWQNSNDNENILHSLVDDVIEEDGSNELTHFWDENMANQSILQSLIEEDVKVPSDKAENDNELIWEANDIAMSLIDIETAEDAVKPQQNSYILEPDLICFSDENDDFFPSDDQTSNPCKEKEDKIMINVYPFQDHSENEDESTAWMYWPFWNEFRSIADIMEAYEETYRFDTKNNLDMNIQEVFWDKHHKKTPKDAANIFKSFKHVSVPNEYKREGVSKKVTQLYEDMEDVYADRASIALSDERSEKKRQFRGRKKERMYGGSNKENETKSGLGHRRPGTPTIQTVTKSSSNKYYDFDSCWIETKIPKKERKTAHVWKNARSQKRLNSKIYAKQPRSSK